MRRLNTAALGTIGAQNPLGGDARREEDHKSLVNHLWDLRNGVPLGNTRNTPEALNLADRRTPDRSQDPEGWAAGVSFHRDHVPNLLIHSRWSAAGARAGRVKCDSVVKKAYQLRDRARTSHPLGRCADCGFRPVGEVALMRRQDGGHTIGGVLTCESVWACPACALKIKAGRAEEIKAGVGMHRQHFGANSMLLCSTTIRHDSSMNLRTLREGLQAAHNDFWRLVPELQKVRNHWAKICGEPCENWKRDRGYIGYVSGTEVTHGAAGWHPHRHYAVAFKESVPEEELERLEDMLAHHWRACVIRHLGEECAPSIANGLDLRPLEIADYLSKLGLEISDVGVKEAKGGNVTPWGLLEEMANGSGAALDAFAEYARAMKGAKCVQFSDTLKKLWARLGETMETETDAELADDTIGALLVFEIPKGDWYKLRCSGRVRHFIEACDAGNLPDFPARAPPGWGDQERAIEDATTGKAPRQTPEAKRAHASRALATYFAAHLQKPRPAGRAAIAATPQEEEKIARWKQEAIWESLPD